MSTPEAEGSFKRGAAETRQRLPYEWGELTWTARAKETAGSIFLSGRYPAPIQALLEFTDNSLAYRNRGKRYPTIVVVTIDKDDDRISVLDFGGLGADADGIKRFLRVGETEDIGISYRGAGAKFAAWFFGINLELRAKKQEDNIEYSTTILGFGDPQVEYRGTVPIEPEITRFDREKGRFEIIVRNLKEPHNLPQGAQSRRILKEVYRPLLTRKRIDTKETGLIEKRMIIDSQGNWQEVADKVALFVAVGKKRREQVQPLEIPLVSPHTEENIKIVGTDKGEKMWFWAGEMDLRNSVSKNVKPGIRFYYDGRLINIDYCGFDERDPRLAGFVGEVHLDHIEGVKEQISVNKSSGVNINSEQWQRVMKAMHKALTPLVEELKKKPLQLFGEKPRFFDDALSQARRLVDFSMRQITEDGVISPEELLLLVGGQTYGQKRPAHGGGEKQPTGKTHGGKPWPKQKAKTIPDQNVDPMIKRIRQSYIDRYDLAELTDPSQVSVVTETRDESADRKLKVLLLNNTHPLVLAAFLEGKLATTRLVGEELIEHIAQEYSKTVDDYLRFKRALRLQFGNMLQSTSEYRALEMRRARETVSTH